MTGAPPATGYRARRAAIVAAREAAASAAQPARDALQAILDEALPYQRDFILDPALWKVVCCERRAGKSFTIALALIIEALRTPGAKCLYLGLSNDSCERIMWSDVLEPLIHQHGIKAELYRSRHEVRFANGSTIYLQGIDAAPQQKNKLRGQAFDLVAIDEAQDFEQDLAQIIEGVLAPTLAQREARCLMAGTPGNRQGLHYFFAINRPDTADRRWKRFKFSWRDNTKRDKQSNLRVCDAVQATVEAEIAANPLVVETPRFKQEWLGLWCIESSARIYRYEPKLNDYQPAVGTPALSPAFLAGASYLLGFDLGYSPDPTSLVVAAFNPAFDDVLYVLSAEEHLEMITSELAARIRYLDSLYRFRVIVGDSANLAVVSDLRRTYNIPIQKADKFGKLAHQMMLNDDFQTNRVRLYAPETMVLSNQLQTVIWDQRALMLGQKREDPRFANHSTDALLYLHHHARHYYFKPANAPGPLSAAEQNQQIAADLIRRARTAQHQANYLLPNSQSEPRRQ